MDARIMVENTINDGEKRTGQVDSLSRPYIRRAENRCCQARTLPVRGPIRPVPGACGTADAARGEKTCSTGKISRPCHPVADHLGNVGFGG